MANHPQLPHYELSDYFNRKHISTRPWIIHGIVREHQITAIGAAFNKGKSPLLQDWAIHTIIGGSWCGRQCAKRPVILFDFETQEDSFQLSISAICERLGIPQPRIPEDLVPFLARGAEINPYTQLLNNAIASSDHGTRLTLLRSALATHPNALVIFDPIELFFDLGEVKKSSVLRIYTAMRSILDTYPHAGFIDAHNLRKSNHNGNTKPDLLTDPHGWLEEICGSLDLMNRCDIRIGVDLKEAGSEIRIINGVIRGGVFNALLVNPATLPQEGETEPIYAGWEWVPADANTTRFALPERMYEQWLRLPQQFKYSEIVPDRIPNGSWIRLKKRAISLGILNLNPDGSYSKVVVDPQGDGKCGRTASKVQ